MLIDMRVHPPLPSIWKPGKAKGASQTHHPDFPRPPSAASGSMLELIAEMDAVNMDYGVVMARNSLPPFGHVPNAELATLFSDHPNRFLGFGSVDLRDAPEQWIAEIGQFMRNPGFRGVNIEPTVSLNTDITGADDRRLYPIYDECQRLNIPVGITLSGILQRKTGRPLTLASPNQVYQVALDFPQLDIHVAHGAYPYVMEMIGVAFVCENIWLSADLYMAKQVPGSGEYAKAAGNYFSKRTVYGSNYPSKPFPQMVQAYRDWGWSENVLNDILYYNAKRLMRLD